MIRTSLALVLATSALAFAARPAAAQEPTPAPASMPAVATAAPPRTFSINVDPFGLVQGYYGGNVEWLHGGHGIVLEGHYWSAGDDKFSTKGGGSYIGYRWHWRGQENSGFLGFMVGGGYGTGVATSTNSAGQMMSYDLTVSTVEVTADIGKRWQLDNGLNITLRLGGGYASRSATTTVQDPDAQQAAKDVESALAFLPIALDGELSLGYTF